MQLSNPQQRTAVGFQLMTQSSFYQFSISLLFWLLIVGINLYPTVQAEPSWVDVTQQAQIDVSAPIRSRRSPDAQVKFKLTNTDSNELVGPLRLVIVGLTPDTVTLGGATGTTADGDSYVDVDTYINTPLAPNDASSEFQLTFVGGGGRNTFSFTVRLEQQQTQAESPSVVITGPETLITVGSTPIQVSGTVNTPSGLLTLNGVAVEHSNGQFQADVALEEGLNTIIARLTDAMGNETTDSIVVSMDLTAPYVTIESPTDGQILNTPSTAVSGLINDIVRGTVNENDANVTVNGIPGSVSNRSYLAQNIPLQIGENTITVTGSDQVGNVGTASIKVTYQPLIGQRIELQTGQNQAGPIRSVLSEPLVVKLVDDNDQPLANKQVIFRVAQGDGIIGIGTADEAQGILSTTDVNGMAQTKLKLGSRSGNGNNRVRATSVGVKGEALFYASATSLPGNKVSINSGNNQRGTAGQPLPQPFIVAVTDEGANVVEGAQVEFQVTTGGGQFQNGQPSISATTDGDGRATAHLTLGEEGGLDNNRVTVTLVGTTISAGFTASGLISGDPGNTRISGVVFDNQDTPLPGVTIRVDGTTRQTQSDAQGQFLLTEVPVGPVHLLVDGATTTVPGEWPTLSYNLVTVAGAENILPAPIYMVKLNTDNAVMVGLQDAEITLDEMPGFKLEVKAGSVTFPDGSRSGLLSVTPVNSSKVPMPPPNGMQPQVIVTIQPVNTRFDPPAKLTLPNVDGHAPGAQVEMYSYDHDLEEFVAIGLGTVTPDGSLVSSNPGIGVIKAGWHCGSQPGGQGCTNNCAICKDCDGDCNCVPKDGDPRLASLEVAGDCKKPECSGGSATQVNDDSDKPEDVAGDCKKPACNAGSPSEENDDNDKPDDICKECKDGALQDIDLDDTIAETTFSFGLPNQTVSKINDALSLLENVGVLASVNLLNVSGKITEQDCCKENLKGKKLSGSVNGNFGGFDVKGKIWPPGPIPTFGPKEIDVFGLASLEVEAKFIGGVFLGLKGAVTGEVGRKKDDCSQNAADRNGCFFGNVKATLTPSLSAEIGGEGTLVFDCIFCLKETIVVAGSLILGEASWPLDISNISYNAQSCSSGITGGLFQPGAGKFKMAAKFSGSYKLEDGGVSKIEKEFSFLSCDITLNGVTCESALF